MRKYATAAAALATLTLVVGACGGDDSTSGAGEQAPEPTSDVSGEFVVEYEEPTTEEGREAQELLRTSEALEQAVDTVNHVVAVPADVPVVVGDAIEREGELMEGPAAVTDEVVFPTQFVTETQLDLTAAAEPDETPEELAAATAETAQFAALHEMGHVLIAALGIPVTGQEEDAVDQFAVVMLAAGAEDTDQLTETAAVTLAAADSFEAMSTDPAEEDWWDEHTLTQQRARTLVCLAAGSSPDAYEALEEVVPQERYLRCPDEFRQAFTSWLTLLEGHYRPGVEAEVEAALTALNEGAEAAAEEQDGAPAA